MHRRALLVSLLLFSLCGVAIPVLASAPEASFTYSPTTPNPGEQVTLDASGSTDNGSIVAYEWDTDGDGLYYEADGERATVTFDSGGTYTVGLKVTDDNDNTDTATKRITVDNPAPEPAFSHSPSTPNPDDRITLDASGSSDPDGRIVSYEWDTDDDGYYEDEGEQTTVTFDSGGTYTVGLKVTDNGGKERTVTKRITVDNPAPTASFSYAPTTPNPDDRVTLDASGSSDPDGSIESYEWDTDDDGYYEDEGERATISFDSGGTYTVGLRVTDNGGKERTVTKRITVDNPAPEPAFSHSPSTPNPDDRITLDASGSSDPDGRIVSYEWDTDEDGYYEVDGERATVTFDSGGTYTIELRVTDNGGKERMVTKRITVENPPPVPSIDLVERNGLQATLDASGSSDPDGRIERFEWRVDGRGVGEGRRTTVEFDSKGEHQVTVVATDNGGKSASTTTTVTVSRPPAGSIDPELSPVPVGQNIELTADVTDPDGTVRNYTWIVKGGFTQRGQRVEVGYGTTGQKTVLLKATDDTGNTVTIRRVLDVREPPELELEASKTSLVDNEDVEFVANAPASVSEYHWDVDDDGTYEADGERLTHSFSDGGEKTVRVKVLGPGGVPATDSVTVTVEEVKPAVAVDWQPDTPRPRQDIVFNATPIQHSVGRDLTITWAFEGSGERRVEKTGQTVTHSFNDTGEYVVEVVAEDEFGDQRSFERVLSVQRSASFSISSQRQTVALGESSNIVFSASNRLRDAPVSAKLALDLPSGISVSGVSGGSLVARAETDFLRIAAGDSESLTVTIQVNEPGEYTVGADAIYYIGNASAGVERRTAAGSVTIDAASPTTEPPSTAGARGPVFPTVGRALVVFLVSLRVYSLVRRE